MVCERTRLSSEAVFWPSFSDIVRSDIVLASRPRTSAKIDITTLKLPPIWFELSDPPASLSELSDNE